MSKAACTSLTAEGARCPMPPGPNGLCLWHDPARAAEAQEARARGRETAAAGRAAARAPRVVSVEDALPAPTTLEDCVRWASWAVHAVATGQIDSKTSREINYGLMNLRFGLEKQELLRRVRELEAQLLKYEAKRKPA